jgi:hypothetical protein
MGNARRFQEFAGFIPLLDSKSVQAFRLFRDHLDALDVGPGRALVAPTHDLIDRILRSFEDRFHSPVGSVPNPSGEAEPASLLRGDLPEKDSLNHPRDQHADPHHHERG